MYRKLIRYSNKIFNLFSIIASITDERLKPQIPTVKIVAAITVMHFTNQGSLNNLSQEIAYKNFKADIPSVSTIARTADTIITPKNWTKNEVRYSYSKGVRYSYEKHNKKKLQSSF